ncbi:adenylate/guanylate cyclase domain-containing protein [Ensifer sp. 4252]|uniref:adenylate/guanylate cyclase domain-containing protein n=1 Tax=Ensifer sp. 4252 TaxID=3373915 RepID=UPI003D1C48FE
MAVAPLDRKLLAILAADIVGFSAAMEADEPGTIARLMAVHSELLDRLIDQYHGRIVKLMGDGTLVTFDSVVDAVGCGAKIQAALAERNAGSAQRDRVMLRIGVNVGDVTLIEGDVYGDAVNTRRNARPSRKVRSGKTELETALRLNPGSFSVLTYYLSWASAFGEPARGADLADRAVKLNPNYQPWASGGLRYAYFMSGRYDDALKVMERQKPENYSKYAWAERAGSLAMLGRKTEADAAVKEALQRFPDLSIEAIANDPAFNAAEHQRHIETMRLAGFPPCASGEVLAGLTKPLRLPECVAKTTP